MKIRLKDIIILLFISLVAVLSLLKLNDFFNQSKIRANINDYESVEVLKSYNLGSIVAFDPVNYRICDDYQGDTCYDFIVISKDGDSYNLIYSGKEENMKWIEKNPVNIINSYTQNWSDNLTVDSKYNIDVTEDYNYDFNKARILTKDEYDVLSDDVKKKIVGDVSSGPRYQYVVINPKYTEDEPTKLDVNTSEFGFVGSAGQYGTDYYSYFSFVSNEQGAYSDVAYIRPVINIDVNNVGNNKKIKYNINFRTFDLYDTIDFDPVNYRFCDDDYESITCYSWVVIKKDGNEYDLYSKTINPGMKWTQANPVDVIDFYTQSWSDKLKIGAGYDIKVNDNYGYYFKGKKARMLKASEYNNSYLEKIAQRNINVVVLNDYSKHLSLSRVDTSYTSSSNSAEEYTLADYYSFNSNANGGYESNAYIAPVIHINLEDGIDNSEEKERKEYICRRATKNITLGQVNTKGELKSGDVFDCDVDGTGYTERFYYVTDLEENNDYGVLIYSHNVRSGRLYDFIGYYDNAVGQDYRNFQYDVDNQPNVNGPKTAISQLPTTNQWNRIRLLNETRDLYDTNNILRVNNFSYEGKAARLLTYKEFLRTCGYEFNEIYDSSISFDLTDNLNSHGGEIDSQKWVQRGLPYMTKMKNLPWAYWLENPFVSSYLDENNQPVFNSYSSVLRIFGSYQGEEKMTITESATDASDKGVRPVIEVKKLNIDYGATVKVTYNDEERIEEKVLPIESKAEKIESKGKEFYSFKYWSLEKNGSEFDFNTLLTNDITLYAVYGLDSYTIEYDLDEGVLEDNKSNPVTYTPETDTFTLNNPSKENNEFLGWTGSNGETPQKEVIITKGSTGNRTYKANFEINKYNVEFYMDDELLNTQKVNHGEKIVKEEIPKVEKVDYEFVGWREDKQEENFDLDKVITKPYKLYAIFKGKKKECVLSLTSKIYKIDEDKKEINNVPENEEIDVIKNNLTIEGTLKEITKDNVIIVCDDKIKTYKINRIWIPKTGNVLTRGMIIFGYLGIILILLFVIRKQIDINKRLRSRL